MEKPIPPSAISYVRSVSRQKACDVPMEHGYPVRAIVPGHYGMALVKRLIRMEALTEPFTGYWQTSDYAYWNELAGKPVRRALGEMKVKSQITHPGVYETLAPNRVYAISGLAWAGETEDTKGLSQPDKHNPNFGSYVIHRLLPIEVFIADL